MLPMRRPENSTKELMKKLKTESTKLSDAKKEAEKTNPREYTAFVAQVKSRFRLLGLLDSMLGREDA